MYNARMLWYQTGEPLKPDQSVTAPIHAQNDAKAIRNKR